MPTKKISQKKAVKKPQAKRYNNPAGCSECSCTMYSQDHGQICTCGHSSRSHTGNNA